MSRNQGSSGGLLNKVAGAVTNVVHKVEEVAANVAEKIPGGHGIAQQLASASTGGHPVSRSRGGSAESHPSHWQDEYVKHDDISGSLGEKVDASLHSRHVGGEYQAGSTESAIYSMSQREKEQIFR